MTHLQSNGESRSVRHRGAIVVVSTAGLLLTLFGGALGASPASAAASTIDPPIADPFPTPTVTISGTKDIGSSIRVPSLTGGDPYCIEAAGHEDWSCTFDLPDGEYDVTVVEDHPTDPATSTEAQVRVRVLSAPIFATNGLTTGLIGGNGHPGAGIVVSATGPESFSGYACTTVQSPGGYWSCPLPLTISGEYTITVTQTWQGTGNAGGSTTRTIVLDRDPPPLAVITRPAPGERVTSQPVAFVGVGESGNRVDVFADGVLVCSVPVVGGHWSCTAAVPTGDRNIQAIQWDAAGNPSGATAGLRITVASGTPAAPRPGTPAAPSPVAPPSPTPSPTQTPTPAPTREPDQDIPLFPPPIGGDSGLPPLDTWATPTHYGAAVPSAWTSASDGTLLLGAALALGYVVLIALALRLLVAALRGRMSRPLGRLAGRNRALPEDEPPLLNPWLTGAGALGASVMLAALAGGIQGEARYLRLIMAIGTALAILNGVGIALAARVSGRALGWRPALRLVPTFLAVATLLTIVSRGGGIQPPMIMGVVIAVAASTAPRPTQGKVALAQLGALTVLAVGAWAGHSAIGPVEGFALSLASETLAALCIAGLGSLMLLLLPVASLPGRHLFEWSRVAWIGTALVAATAAATVVASSPTFPLAWVVAIALGFATASVAAWSWIRFVEPQLLPRDT